MNGPTTVGSLSTVLLGMLACPFDRSALAPHGSGLGCEHGHSFPVVDGVPVLLRDDVTETIGIARASLDAAREASEGRREDPWFARTLGLYDEDQVKLKALIARGDGPVDPVASILVAATNGILYRPLIGRLADYPVPRLRLPPGNGKRLLDVGCSWGRWSLAASQMGYRAVGIDPSLGAVLAAQRIARQRGSDFLGVVGDARHLPFKAGAFDTVFSYSVLQHFSKPEATSSLEEMRRVLTHEGAALIQMASTYGVRSMLHQARRGYRQPRGFEVRYWSPAEMRATFTHIFGRCTLVPDCYFGLGLQPSDRHLFGPAGSTLIACSESLRMAARTVRPLAAAADSVYLSNAPID